MPKAAVIHHTLNSPGGESTVAIETIESLYELGYEVELVTVQPPDLDGISKSYGKKIHIARIKSLLPFKLNYFGVYQRLLTMLSSMDFQDSDVVINTHGDALPYKISGNVPYLLYLHFPTFLMNSRESTVVISTVNLFSGEHTLSLIVSSRALLLCAQLQDQT